MRINIKKEARAVNAQTSFFIFIRFFLDVGEQLADGVRGGQQFVVWLSVCWQNGIVVIHLTKFLVVPLFALYDFLWDDPC